MRRRLLLLNLVLVVLLGATGMRYWQIHRDARAREQRTLNVRIVPEKAVALPPAPAHAPVAAVSYLDVAQKMLFARDRNPNVIIDATPPPPPPVMPALPQFYGLMTGFGDPGIILSEKSGGPQKTYRVGEMVGAFKLMGFDNANIVFDWDGTKVQRPLSELVAKVTAPSGSNTPGAQAASVAPPPQVVNALPLGPGQDIGGGFRACQSNDSTPNGAVQGGMKKVEVQGMFGKSCRWEPVR